MMKKVKELKPDPAALNLQECYFRLRKESKGLCAHTHRFEGLPWQFERAAEWPHEPHSMAILRSVDGWELRVYRIDGDIEACVIRPDGQSFTYA